MASLKYNSLVKLVFLKKGQVAATGLSLCSRFYLFIIIIGALGEALCYGLYNDFLVKHLVFSKTSRV